jgi:hypothetical protein
MKPRGTGIPCYQLAAVRTQQLWVTFAHWTGDPGNANRMAESRSANRRVSTTLRHRCHRIECREAAIRSKDIKLTLDQHSGYRRYRPGLEPVID